MTNKEQIQRDLAVAFDFIGQVLDNPELLDKIPEGSAITFLNEVNSKVEQKTRKIPMKKYVKVKRQFEVL